MGRALHLAGLLSAMLRNSLPGALAMLGWSCSCLSTVVSFMCKKTGLINCTKGGAMYGECLVLHQLLDGKLCYTFIYIHAWNHY